MQSDKKAELLVSSTISKNVDFYDRSFWWWHTSNYEVFKKKNIQSTFQPRAVPADDTAEWIALSLFRTRSCSWPHFFSFDLSLILAHFHAPILFLLFSRSGSRFRFCTLSHSRSLPLSSNNKNIYKMNI